MVVVAILAAGRGTRMKSDLPKVLHSVGGRSLLQRVLDSCHSINPSQRLVIVGYQAEQVKQALQSYEGLEFVEQTEQLGTGHAIQQLLPHLDGFTGDLRATRTWSAISTLCFLYLAALSTIYIHI